MLKAAPGIALTIAITALASWIEVLPVWPFTITGPIPHPIDRMILAILIGMGVSHLTTLSDFWKAGIDFTTKRLLPLAIVLMGARLDYRVALSISWQGFWINIICIVTAYFLTLALCRYLHIHHKMAVLLGIGTAICGSTAIVAAVPVIRANETETSLAITTITLFGILAIFFYPFLGHRLGLSETEFGIWVGTAIQSVPQVVAAGFAYGDSAGEIALLVKLVRILFLAPFILYLSIWNHRKDRQDDKEKAPQWYRLIPLFVYGFIAMLFLSSMGWISNFSVKGTAINLQNLLSRASSLLIVMAMAGVGLQSQLRGVLKTNIKVLAAGFMSATILGVLSYLLILIFVQ